MKKLLFTLLTGTSLFLAGCFETTDEITLNSDGSGVYSTTNDLSAAMGLAKQMGGADADKMEDTKVDSTISLATQVDSIPSLTAEEKELMKNGTMRIKVDMKEEKALFTLVFPFKKISDIEKFSKLSAKLMAEVMKDKLAGAKDPGGEEMPEASSFDKYYKVNYENGKIEKKLDKDKYKDVESDEYLKGMREAGAMGISISTTQVINLPRPAKKVEGKNAKLSDDKKKVTIKAGIDDFFDTPEALEYKIEY